MTGNAPETSMYTVHIFLFASAEKLDVLFVVSTLSEHIIPPSECMSLSIVIFLIAFTILYHTPYSRSRFFHPNFWCCGPWG